MDVISEVWASAYLQILMGLMVFALGVPAFAIELIVLDEVKHIAHKHVEMRGWLLSIVILFLAASAFVWMIHPVMGPGASGSGADSHCVTGMGAAIANVLITVAPLIAALFGYHLVKIHRRESVVARLKDEILSEWTQHRHLNTVTLDDLVYLGVHAQRENEKHDVLNVLDCIAQKTQQPPYRGDETEPIVRAIERVVLGGVVPSSDKVFRYAEEILTDIHNRFRAAVREYHADEIAIRSVIPRLCLAVVNAGTSDAALTFLQKATALGGAVVYSIAIDALLRNYYVLATVGLTHLEDTMERTGMRSSGEARRDAVSNWLGLVARLHVRGGAAANRAVVSIENVSDAIGGNLADMLIVARDYHYEQAHFDTCDAITALAAAKGIELGDFATI